MLAAADWLGVAFLLIALVYASVGQAGASGYLAVMALTGFAPEAMKTTALSLNLLVAAIATCQFWRVGLLSWRTFYPFGVLGIPFSLVGGAINVPPHAYYAIVGAILLLSGLQMARSAIRTVSTPSPPTAPPLLPALAAGGVIGFVSGSTGTGGGVFLAPVILAMNWVDVRRTAAVTATYNLLNSAAALLGAYRIMDSLPAALPKWLVAVGIGGAIGAFLGARHLPERGLRFGLAAILSVSGIKLIFS